jgi:hypothetical protein
MVITVGNGRCRPFWVAR